MTHPNSPVIIRQSPTQSWTKPGLHTHNARRRFHAVRDRISKLSILQLCLVALGLAGVGYYTYTVVDQYVYQSFQNWAFDEGIAGHSDVTFGDYLRSRTLFGFLTREQEHAAMEVPAESKTVNTTQEVTPVVSARPVHGALLGRLEIARLHLSAIVREGVDDKVLSLAVGHVPSTALAGQLGNFAIAAHRDTLFRALKDIRSNDLVTFQLPQGTVYQYRVAATEVVKPSDISVLRADGGGLITGGGSTQGMPKLLTMITCYPFSYVGSAPKRFIVEAKIVEGDDVSKPAIPVPVTDQGIVAPTSQREAVLPIGRTAVHAAPHQKRSLSRVRRFPNKRARVIAPSPSPVKPAKKKGFWRKIFGNA